MRERCWRTFSASCEITSEEGTHANKEKDEESQDRDEERI